MHARSKVGGRDGRFIKRGSHIDVSLIFMCGKATLSKIFATLRDVATF